LVTVWILGGQSPDVEAHGAPQRLQQRVPTPRQIIVGTAVALGNSRQNELIAHPGRAILIDGAAGDIGTAEELIAGRKRVAFHKPDHLAVKFGIGGGILVLEIGKARKGRWSRGIGCRAARRDPPDSDKGRKQEAADHDATLAESEIERKPARVAGRNLPAFQGRTFPENRGPC